ncbi:YSC84-related protein [Thiohalobacter sp. IOR34]|uniref:YSC84-related protein n=1 Tax=Thiohalobacter sp. IOR34 TaxID=3057176 RepID=UPI0025AF5342|nr:YSC84-related protein [Thiohalobacter sp. IOR34]WJW74990.1 YSC84-related protein [Thiohalobacter sp. IOR34]
MRHALAPALLILGLCQSAAIQAGWNPFREEAAASRPTAKDHEVAAAIAAFRAKDPDMKVFFDKAYGYAVFPTVGKGGIGIGGAYGKGEVFVRGRHVGYTSLSQLTIGFQFGGQAYSEIIFFRDKATMEDFQAGNFEFSAQASAVAATAGASADADYSNGVAIFTLAKGGLMYEASVGGQKFSFTPRK